MIESEGRPGSKLLDDKASFCSFIQGEFDLPERPDGRDRLVEDLGFDSFLLLELVVVIHEAFGRSSTTGPKPAGEYPILTTVDDALAYAFDTAAASGEAEATAVRAAQ
ncbi:MAG: hypothetical protein M0Z62_12940 [Actinomycetota bacterium]|nr:hypothetical protein [Actinomycetota bacterium]